MCGRKKADSVQVLAAERAYESLLIGAPPLSKGAVSQARLVEHSESPPWLGPSRIGCEGAAMLAGAARCFKSQICRYTLCTYI